MGISQAERKNAGKEASTEEEVNFIETEAAEESN